MKVHLPHPDQSTQRRVGVVIFIPGRGKTVRSDGVAQPDPTVVTERTCGSCLRSLAAEKRRAAPPAERLVRFRDPADVAATDPALAHLVAVALSDEAPFWPLDKTRLLGLRVRAEREGTDMTYLSRAQTTSLVSKALTGDAYDRHQRVWRTLMRLVEAGLVARATARDGQVCWWATPEAVRAHQAALGQLPPLQVISDSERNAGR